MYKIIFDEKVIQFMEKLDYSTRFNIFENLRIIKRSPLEFAKKLNNVYLIFLQILMEIFLLFLNSQIY